MKSIRKRLALLEYLMIAGIFILVFILYFTFQWFDFKNNIERELKGYKALLQNEILASLSFKDKETCLEDIKAFASVRHITYLGIYDKNGKIFAVFSKNGGSDESVELQEGFFFKSGFFHFISPLGNEGKIYIKSNLIPFYEHMRDFSVFMFISFFLALFAGYIISRFVTSRVIDPLIRLADFVKKYGAGKTEMEDIDIRTGDEIEFLSNSIKEMMEKIEDWKKKIESKKDELEMMVQERTKDLIEKTQMLKREMEEKERIQKELIQFQKFEGIGKLAGGIAHDFNNLLTIIKGYVSLLRMDILEGREREYLDRMMSAVDRASELVSALLAYSRKQVLVLEARNVNEIVKKSENMLKRLIGEDITIRLNLFPEKIPILVDEVQIFNVLINLATNARDAMPHGGEIEIKTERASIQKRTWLKEFYIDEGDYAVIRFSDTGVGMDEETRKKIFEPFFTTKEVGKGTGLGLSTVYGIVKQHGGFILCESEPLKGTTFTIYLPVTDRIEKEETNKKTPEDIKRIELREFSVLIAEDEEHVRSFLKNLLESSGFLVEEAENGKMALEIITKDASKFDLFILDVIMPEMNGYELSKRIKEIRPDAKIIFVSGYTDEIIRERIRGEKIEFLSKPLDPKDTIQKIKEVLS